MDEKKRRLDITQYMFMGKKQDVCRKNNAILAGKKKLMNIEYI